MDRSDAFYLLYTSLFGAILLVGFSTLQKFVIGAPVAKLTGYIVPLLFGGVSGLIYGYFARQKHHRIQRLRREVRKRKDTESDRRRFKKAAEAAGHGVYMMDLEGHIQWVNPAFETLTGYPEADLLGEKPGTFHSGDMTDDFCDLLWETLEAGGTWEGEVIVRRKAGERYTAHETIAPIGEATDAEGFVAIQTDVSEREQLHQRLSIVNRVLRHDIRSAVSVIRGNSDLVKTEAGDIDAALDTIDAEAKRLYQLSEKARHVENGLAGERVVRQNVDVCELLQTHLAQLQDRHPEVSIDADLPTSARVTASVRFEDAIEELLRNAIEHNDASEPKLDVGVENTGESPCAVNVRIEDNGPGIPDGEVEPLRKGEETELEHTSGLGLWVVKWTVEESGGELSISETPDGGSQVSIELPAAA